mmetsp:Transcript_66820/g.204586  ORF Transcript_66820/g.204586 Transcript_66820/m.204586 type:complete len:330 (-) Transcript_66820:38-1027(-)
MAAVPGHLLRRIREHAALAQLHEETVAVAHILDLPYAPKNLPPREDAEADDGEDNVAEPPDVHAARPVPVAAHQQSPVPEHASSLEEEEEDFQHEQDQIRHVASPEDQGVAQEDARQELHVRGEEQNEADDGVHPGELRRIDTQPVRRRHRRLLAVGRVRSVVALVVIVVVLVALLGHVPVSLVPRPHSRQTGRSGRGRHISPFLRHHGDVDGGGLLRDPRLPCMGGVGVVIVAVLLLGERGHRHHVRHGHGAERRVRAQRRPPVPSPACQAHRRRQARVRRAQVLGRLRHRSAHRVLLLGAVAVHRRRHATRHGDGGDAPRDCAGRAR